MIQTPFVYIDGPEGPSVSGPADSCPMPFSTKQDAERALQLINYTYHLGGEHARQDIRRALSGLDRIS
jgi:hypothetical protein